MGNYCVLCKEQHESDEKNNNNKIHSLTHTYALRQEQHSKHNFTEKLKEKKTTQSHTHKR